MNAKRTCPFWAGFLMGKKTPTAHHFRRGFLHSIKAYHTRHTF